MAKKRKFGTPPRERADRDNRYMGMAWMWAYCSKDPQTQVGAIIVSSDNRPLGSGYNGPPSEMDDNLIDWSRPAKYDFIRHAEHNAIDFCSERPVGATLYVSGPPCKSCINDMVAAKIKRCVYFSLRKNDPGSMLASQEDWKKVQEIAELGKVKLEEFDGNIHWMKDYILIDMAKNGAFG